MVIFIFVPINKLRRLAYFILPHFVEELFPIVSSRIGKRYLAFLPLYKSAFVSKEYQVSRGKNLIYEL